MQSIENSKTRLNTVDVVFDKVSLELDLSVSFAVPTVPPLKTRLPTPDTWRLDSQKYSKRGYRWQTRMEIERWSFSTAQ